MEGYKDTEEFLFNLREEFQSDVDADRVNREAALDDLKFMADFEGAQWDATARKERERQGLPCLTINQLQQLVAQVSGDNRINKPSIKVRPAEDADKDLADIRSGLIRAIEWQSDSSGVYGKASDSQIVCGLGHFRVGLEYAGDDVFDQDIRIRQIPNPLSVVWDYMSSERTGKDARRCWVVDEMPRKAFEEMYPDKAASDLGETATGDLIAGGWCSRDTVRVVEAWRIKETPRKLGLMVDGSVKDVTDLRNAEAMVQKDAQGAPRIREVMKRSAVMYLVTGFSVLEGPYELPITRLPIFKVSGREVNVGQAKVRFGLIRFAKDSQRLKNYWRSVSAQLLGWAPKQTWLATEDAVQGREEDFRHAASSGDPLLIMNKVGTVERLLPAPIPSAVMQEVAMNTQDMKDVTGLHDASLGIKSNETSGKAILARQREGDVATIEYHDNLNAAIRECGVVINELIPITYDTVRTIRVLGADEEPKLVRINDPNDPDSVDISKGKYDTVVETGPSYSTRRVEAADSLMQAVQAFPQLMGVAGDLVVKAQDWPDAEPIAERLKKALPPNLVDPPENPSPEEQQRAQQAAQQQAQQQQMQEAAGQLELMGKQAEVRKAEAEAAKAEAEASKARTEANTSAQEAAIRRTIADADKAEAQAVEATAKAGLAVQEAQFAPFDKQIQAANAGLDISDRLSAEPEDPAN